MIDGKLLTDLREQHGYTIDYVCKYMDVSRTTMRRWEKENALDSIKYAKLFAELYSIPLSDLIGKDTETAFANAVVEEPEQEEITHVEETAGTEEKAAKKQLSLVKIGAITAASTFTLFAIVTAIIILCVYFQPNTFDGENFNVITNSLEMVVIICLMLASVILVTTATVLSFYFIRKRRK